MSGDPSAAEELVALKAQLEALKAIPGDGSPSSGILPGAALPTACPRRPFSCPCLLPIWNVQSQKVALVMRAILRLAFVRANHIVIDFALCLQLHSLPKFSWQSLD